jgi:hypothetical protein
MIWFTLHSLFLSVFPQGQWGTTASQEEVDMRLRRTFVEEKVPSLRSEFVVLHDSFKVQYWCESSLVPTNQKAWGRG